MYYLSNRCKKLHKLFYLFKGQLKPDAAEVRWKYLRENYLKARKKQKIKEEIARRNGIPLPTCNKNRKYSFRYYEIMRFLDDTLDYQYILKIL